MQSLVVESFHGNIKKIAKGIDHKRFLILIAIIEKYCRIRLSHHDIYINVVDDGETRIADLAIVGSILNSYYKKSTNNLSILLGEIDLCGNIKSIENIDNEISFLKEHKLHKLTCNYDFKCDSIGQQVKRIEDLAELLAS